jgi:hypothetical protein
MKNSKGIRLLLAFLAVVLIPKICAAGTIVIPASGGGVIADNKSENSLNVSGSGFSFSGLNAGSNGAYCGLNIPCSPFLQGDVIGQWAYQGFSGMADASIRIVAQPFTISSTCVDDPDPLACMKLDPWSAGPFPASFTASITGLSGDPIIGTIIGAGSINLSDGSANDSPVIYFNTAAFGFAGNASLATSPEPGSIVLAGTGILALLGAIRRKGRARPSRISFPDRGAAA